MDIFRIRLAQFVNQFEDKPSSGPPSPDQLPTGEDIHGDDKMTKDIKSKAEDLPIIQDYSEKKRKPVDLSDIDKILPEAVPVFPARDFGNPQQPAPPVPPSPSAKPEETFGSREAVSPPLSPINKQPQTSEPKPVPLAPEEKGYFGGSSNPPSNKKGILAIAGIIAALIVVSAGAVAAVLAMRIWDPLWNPFREKPEAVVGQMLVKMGEVKTAHFKESALLGVTFGESSKDKIQITLGAEGDSDGTSADNPKSSLAFNIGGSLTYLGITGNFSASADGKVVDKNFYYKLNNLVLPMPILEQALEKEAGIKLSDIKNKWYKVSKEDLNNLNSYAGSTAISEEQKEELAKKILDIVSKDKLYYVKEQLPDTVIGGNNVYHYIVSLDKEKTKAAITDIITEELKIMGAFPSMDDSETTIATTMMKGYIGEILDGIGEINVDLWIGKKDKNLYRANFGKEISGKLLGLEADGKLSVNFILELSKFDEPVDITAPKDAVDLKPAIDNIKKKMEESEKINSIGYNMSLLTASAEAVKTRDKSFINVKCSDALIKPVCDAVKGITGKDPIIIRYGSAYCGYAAIALPGETFTTDNPASYYCVSNSGAGGITKTYPGTAPYCTGKTFACPLAENTGIK